MPERAANSFSNSVLQENCFLDCTEGWVFYGRLHNENKLLGLSAWDTITPNPR